MSSDWKSKVQDPKARKVFEALSDPEWDFRTVEGISKATGLPDSEVKEIVSEYQQLIRRSPVSDNRGRALFTLKERPFKAKEFIAELRSFVTKST